MNGQQIKRLTRNAMLATIALIIFVLEAQIPPPIPISGVKLGLSNIVTVYAIFMCGRSDAFVILLCRIVLGSIFAGQMMSFLYSLCGGMLCYFFMLAVQNIVTEKQIWVCSVVGAIAHNVGQISVAMIVMQTTAVVAYLPILLISGVLSGTFTGICAQLVVRRMRKK